MGQCWPLLTLGPQQEQQAEPQWLVSHVILDPCQSQPTLPQAHTPASQPLVMRVRRAWHTVTLRSGRSLMAMPSVRASPRKEEATSVGLVQKPGRRVQIWVGKGKDDKRCP